MPFHINKFMALSSSLFSLSLSQKMSEYNNLPGQVYFLAYALTSYRSDSSHVPASSCTSSLASDVTKHHNSPLPRRRMGHDDDDKWCSWPPRSRDLTPCDSLSVPPLSPNFGELELWITKVVTSVTRDIAIKVWDATEYRLAVCLRAMVCLNG